MPEEQAIVIRVKEGGMADVLTERSDACGHCSASACCSTSGGGSNKMVTRALNKAGARAGDTVIVSLGSGVVVKSAAVVYLLPIIGFIAGAAAGASMYHGLGISETISAVLFGFGGLAVGFLTTILLSRSAEVQSALTPEITRVKHHGPADQLSAAIDPVCKMVVDKGTAQASLDYKGETYYFCNPGCKEAFSREPEKYLESSLH